MICIKTGIKYLPKYCDECIYYASRPHPYKGWSDICELCGEFMDEDAKQGWEYDGNEKPKNCPLIEVDEKAVK